MNEPGGQGGLLEAGARLGHYELLGTLGAGGMGEVYRARDLVLERDVALKRLPASLRADRLRLEHFAREARAAARLTHPNVMAIFELAEITGETFIVTELLEGQSLRERLAGGALPWRKAVEYAVQACAGLGAAHERGITHCDLKPENLFITHEDRIKILDFGLARLAEDVASVGTPPATATLQSAATLRGTVGYLAPEQIRGAAIDQRADLFALGAILYEMLSGRRAFPGATAAESLGSVLRDEPAPLPPGVPAVLANIVFRCLEKEPATRFHSAHDLRLALEAVGSASSTGAGLPRRPVGRRRARSVAAAGALAALLVGLGYLAGALSGRGASDVESVRFTIDLPPGTGLVEFTAAPLALVPDGKGVVLALADLQGNSKLWLRRFDDEKLEAIAGTDGATSPFVSPDGQSIAFAARGRLWRVSIAGGMPRDITEAQQFFGGCWLDDDTIVYAPRFAGGLWRIPALGGQPEQLTKPGGGQDAAHLWPTCLPGGRAVLFSVWRGGEIDDGAVAYLRMTDRTRGTLVEGGYHPRFLRPDTLLFARSGAVMSAEFDADALQLRGVPRQRVGGLLANINSVAAFYETSNGDHLAYVQGTYERPQRRLVWRDRDGGAEYASDLRMPFSLPRISPDGRRVATWLQDDEVAIWLLDLSGDRLTRLSRGLDDHSPVWSPDGSRIAFDSSRTGNYEIYLTAAHALADETPLTRRGRDHFVNAWLPDDRLLFTDHSVRGGSDLWSIAARPGAEAEPLLRTPFNESEPAVSTDGRWIAYVADDTGRNEVFVRRYPLQGPRIQASRDGGEEPAWSRDANELYFRNGAGLFAVRLTGTADDPGLTEPQQLFAGRYHYNLYPTNSYDVAPDGRFLMVEEPAPVARTIHVVLFFAASTGRR